MLNNLKTSDVIFVKTVRVTTPVFNLALQFAEMFSNKRGLCLLERRSVLDALEVSSNGNALELYRSLSEFSAEYILLVRGRNSKKVANDSE